MSVELLLADNDNLRKQLARTKVLLGERERQLAEVRSLARQLDTVLLDFAAKLHFKEMALCQGRQIRLDSTAFHDLVADVGQIKEKVQQLHDVLEQFACDNSNSNSSPEAAPTDTAVRGVNDGRQGTSSPLTSSQGTRISLAPPPTPYPHSALRKQISWDPSTTAAAATAAAGRSNENKNNNSNSSSIDGEHPDDEEERSEAATESSQSLQDGILASASAGAIGLKTLQLFSRRSNAVQGPQSRRWFNRLRCCSFQECAVIIHLVYLHLIALVAIGGVTCLIVGTTLAKKEYLVAGTVLVIASYGLFLNHCFYRSATVSSNQTAAAQKVRIRDIDLEASTSETINIDLTRPPTRNMLQVDLDSSQLSRAY